MAALASGWEIDIDRESSSLLASAHRSQVSRQRPPANQADEVKEHPAMSAPSRPLRRPREVDHYRELIHTLHQRYYREWLRAEQLERELQRVRGRWLGPILAWLLSLKRWLRPLRNSSSPTAPVRSAPCPIVIENSDPVCGRVSIVIPFKDRVELLRDCLRSLRRSTWRDFEVILVDNGSTQRRTARYLERLRRRNRATVVDCPGLFNFSHLCNEGAKAARGDYVLFLNNDTEVLTTDWLEQMIRVARVPQVGVVSATLLYPDGTIQHAGLFPRADGRWIHAYRGCPAESAGDRGELQHIRAVPAVSGACLLMQRDRFFALGGFDESLPLTYNDVDLCCRVRQQQLLVVVTPQARLLHFECLSRGFTGDSPGTSHLATLREFPAAG
jgi:GT2 family glycosyltransferase